MTQSLEAKLQQVVDVEDIRTLMAKYCHGIDKKNEELFMSIWSDDATYELPHGVATGTDAIRELVHTVWQRVPKCHHHITNHLVTVDGDRATADTDVFYYRQSSEGVVQLLSGMYSMEYARVDGEWKTRRLAFASFDTVSPRFESEVG